MNDLAKHETALANAVRAVDGGKHTDFPESDDFPQPSHFSAAAHKMLVPPVHITLSVNRPVHATKAAESFRVFRV